MSALVLHFDKSPCYGLTLVEVKGRVEETKEKLGRCLVAAALTASTDCAALMNPSTQVGHVLDAR